MRPSSRHSVKDKVQAPNQRNLDDTYQRHQTSEWKSQSRPISQHSYNPLQQQQQLRHTPSTRSIASDMFTEPSLPPSTPSTRSTYTSSYTLQSSQYFPTEHLNNLSAAPQPQSRPYILPTAPASASAATFGFYTESSGNLLPRPEDNSNNRGRSRTVSTFSGILSNNTSNKKSNGSTKNRDRGHHDDAEEDSAELLSNAAYTESEYSTYSNGLKKIQPTVTTKPTLGSSSSLSSTTKGSAYTLTPTSEEFAIDGDEEKGIWGVRGGGRGGRGGDNGASSHPTITWGVPKRFPFLLIFLYFVGISAAVSNYFFYRFLNNHEYTSLHPFTKSISISPEWISRLSILFPLIVTSCFNSVTALSLGQIAWFAVRRPRDGISIRGIDALFSLSRDIRSPFRLLSSLRDVNIFTVSASFLAVFAWFVPLTFVFVPPTLTHDNQQQWKFNPFVLIIAYASASFVTLLSLIFGIVSVKANGVVQETGFAGILCATRNRELDDVMRGYSMGGVGVRSGTAGKVRLLFGETEKSSGASGERHVAFGLVGRVMGVEKGGLYS